MSEKVRQRYNLEHPEIPCTCSSFARQYDGCSCKASTRKSYYVWLEEFCEEQEKKLEEVRDALKISVGLLPCTDLGEKCRVCKSVIAIRETLNKDN